MEANLYQLERCEKLNIDEILDRHDEPISTPTWVSHYILAKKYPRMVLIFFLEAMVEIMLCTTNIYDDFPYYFADLYKTKKHTKLNKELNYWQSKHNHSIFTKIN